MSEISNPYEGWTTEDIRLIILKALGDEDNGTMHDGRLELELQRFGYNKTRDFIRNQLAWLEKEAEAIRTTTAGSAMVATIRKAGRAHLNRARFIPGIKRPSDVD